MKDPYTKSKKPKRSRSPLGGLLVLAVLLIATGLWLKLFPDPVTAQPSRPPENPETLAERVLVALQDVEAANLSSTGTDGSCHFADPTVAVSSGSEARFLEVAAGIAGITCTSTKTTFSVTVKPQSAPEVHKVAQKDPEVLKKVEDVAREVAQLTLLAMADVTGPAVNPTGSLAKCAYAAQAVTVVAADEAQSVAAPPPVHFVTCTSTDEAHQVTVTTLRDIAVTETLSTAPANPERDQKLKRWEQTRTRNWVREVLQAMEAVEKANPQSSGTDTVCRFLEGGVLVTSGSAQQRVHLPVQNPQGRCESTSSQNLVEMTNRWGDTVSENRKKPGS